MQRATSCFASTPGDCKMQAGPKPLSQQACQENSTCPFDAWCPLGQGQSFSCPAQTASVLALLSLPFWIVCFCLAHRLRRKWGPVENGTSFIKSMDSSVSFSVIRPSIRPQASDCESRPSLLQGQDNQSW